MKRLLASAILVTSLAAFSGCSKATQIVSQNLDRINASWTDNAVDHRGSVGTRYVYVCPPNTAQTGLGAVWGTDTYSDDSSVCAAAVHAGAISLTGGSATIEIRGGMSSYAGSSRNGVTSQDWGAWAGSFVVL